MDCYSWHSKLLIYSKPLNYKYLFCMKKDTWIFIYLLCFRYSIFYLLESTHNSLLIWISCSAIDRVYTVLKICNIIFIWLMKWGYIVIPRLKCHHWKKAKVWFTLKKHVRNLPSKAAWARHMSSYLIDFQTIARVKNTETLKKLLVPISWRLGQTNICQESLILPWGKAVDKMTSKGLFPASFSCDTVIRPKFPWEHQVVEPQPFCGVIHQGWEGYFHKWQCKQFLLSRIMIALILFFTMSCCKPMLKTFRQGKSSRTILEISLDQCIILWSFFLPVDESKFFNPSHIESEVQQLCESESDRKQEASL